MGPGERTLLPGHVCEWGHHVGLQGVRSVLVGPVDDSFAGFQNYNGLGGAVHQQKRSLLSLRVTGGLRGVKIVMVDPVDDQRPSTTPIFLGDCEKPSTGPAITILTT